MKKLHACTAVAVATSMTPIALAEIDLAWDGMYAHEAIRYSLDEAVTWDAESRARQQFAFAGALNMNDGELQLFCIELQQAVTPESVPYEAGPFDTTDPTLQNRVRVLSSLFDGFYEEVVATRDNARAAAFAMLTWEIMSEQFSDDAMDLISEIDLERGAAQFGEYSTAAAAAVTEMKASLFMAANADNLIHYANAEYQDFVGQVPSPGALALLGLASVSSRRRRRR